MVTEALSVLLIWSILILAFALGAPLLIRGRGAPVKEEDLQILLAEIEACAAGGRGHGNPRSASPPPGRP